MYYSAMPVSVVDLFCGAGGLTQGFVEEAFVVNAGVDIDPHCHYAYEHNNHATFLLRDVNDLSADEVAALYPRGDTKILAGCAPCQPFSTYTQGHRCEGDDRWDLLRAFGQLARVIRPEVVTMENVVRLKRHALYAEFVTLLERAGYIVSEYEAFCPDYGVPQVRKRLVVFASLLGPIKLVPRTHAPEHYPTVWATIGRMEPLQAGEASSSDALHTCSTLSQTNLRRIRASKPGGTWRDWESSLVAECHKKTTGRAYTSVYGRMEWHKPSPTITTQFNGFGNGRFGHPVQDRAISLREGALLQTFPSEYAFVEPSDEVEFAPLARLIGNAVPVALGRAIAKSIRNHLEV